jgi:fused signal recognition particle receptor
MSGLLQFFKKGFSKTSERIASVFGSKKLDAETIEAIEELLITADFGVETTDEIVAAIQQAYRKDKEMRQRESLEIARTVILQRLEGSEGRVGEATHRPEVICLVGVNGSGKTTTAAKLGKHLTDMGKTVLVGACDTFRAAANEQLKTWCDRLSLPLVASQHGADSAAVAYDAYEAARSRGVDYLILDTAGRLHTKTHLMEELTKIQRVLRKHDPQAPHHSWLVVDGSIGTNSIQQAKVFHQAFPLTGLVVTKLDGTSKGGALVAIFQEMRIPVFFVGLGEKPDALKPFDREDYASAIFGSNSQS